MLHYIVLHCVTIVLHYIVLHCVTIVTLHCVTLCYNCVTLCYNCYITLCYIVTIVLHCIMFVSRYITLCYIASCSYRSKLHCVTLHYVRILLSYIILCDTLYYIVILQFTVTLHYMVSHHVTLCSFQCVVTVLIMSHSPGVLLDHHLLADLVDPTQEIQQFMNPPS